MQKKGSMRYSKKVVSYKPGKELSAGINLVGTLILNFQPLEYKKIYFSSLSRLVCGIVLWRGAKE